MALGPFRRASLHAIARGSDDFGPMGEALFTLFAVFGPLFGQGAGEPYFTGRGGPYLHAPARTNYLSPPGVRAWRAFLRGRWGAVFYQALAASGPEGHFTRYFTCIPISLGPWARHFSRYLQCLRHFLGRARKCRILRDAEGLFCTRPLERITVPVLRCVRGARS